MVFVFDIDDTICETDAYSEEYILNYFKENNLPYKKVNNITRFAEQKFDWDRETANNWYKTFGDDMLLKFPIKQNSKEILAELKKKGHKIVLATARGDDWHSDPKTATKQWLKDNEIAFDKLFVGRRDKEVICKEEKADFFIDDDINISMQVAEYNKDSNIKVFVATTNYNENLQIPETIKRLNDLKDLLGLVD